MIILHEMKDESESTPDLNTPGFEPGTQWSEDECATARPVEDVYLVRFTLANGELEMSYF